MKTLLAIFVLFIFGLNGFGQAKSITLQIDTLILNNFENFHINFNPGFANISERIEFSTYRFSKSNPHFTCHVPINSDTAKIEISVDNEGGYLVINQAHQLKSDTIKINKLSIFENCFIDTSYIKKEYFKVSKDGSIEKPFKVKLKKHISKNKCKNEPIEEILYTINNSDYLVTLQKKHAFGVEFTTFHGGYPKKYLKDRDNYKKSYKYFYGNSVNHHYIYYGEVNIQN